MAPSGPVDPERLEAGVRMLEGMGLRVTTGKHVLDRAGFLAGADADRAADLRRAWCDPEVRAVVCARGGYGATRLLGLLDWEAMARAEPKILLGSSDITALHQAFAVRLGVATCFGPMPASVLLTGDGGPEPRSHEHLAAALFRDRPLTVRGDTVLAPGRVVAPITGVTSRCSPRCAARRTRLAPGEDRADRGRQRGALPRRSDADPARPGGGPRRGRRDRARLVGGVP
ncbi:LD-carboxypeptidase [Thermocatellispora tengchongensis]|uniref:LD-carboxypeptidase n=1 Tax=Thermocatellispora tengchongensis TaxID=1073253 RepID=UPI00362DAE03